MVVSASAERKELSKRVQCQGRTWCEERAEKKARQSGRGLVRERGRGCASERFRNGRQKLRNARLSQQ